MRQKSGHNKRPIEDKLLVQGMDGYRDDQKRDRYRRIPGIY
jgi:hypothetical protein